jgi:predicted RNase H-like HicB family nuclease
MNISIPVTIFKEGKAFVAYSPVLDLSTSAKTFAGVKKRFREVVELFFEELVEAGTFDEVLTDLGWQKVQRTWSPPMQVAHEMTNVVIPQVN